MSGWVVAAPQCREQAGGRAPPPQASVMEVASPRPSRFPEELLKLQDWPPSGPRGDWWVVRDAPNEPVPPTPAASTPAMQWAIPRLGPLPPTALPILARWKWTKF